MRSTTKRGRSASYFILLGWGGKERLKKSLKEQLVAGGNLYLVTHPLAEGKSVSEIEDLFAERTRAVVIDGQGLSLRDDYSPQVSYGKTPSPNMC